MNNTSFSMSSFKNKDDINIIEDKMKPTTITREVNSDAFEEVNDNTEKVVDTDSPTTLTNIESPPFVIESIEVYFLLM